MTSHISWLKEWQHGVKSCLNSIQQTYFTQIGVKIAQDVVIHVGMTVSSTRVYHSRSFKYR